jgi:hypothetical protein
MFWKKRGSLKTELLGGTRYAKREKDIHYDTDRIREQQQEIVRTCDDCGGLITLDSVASTGNHIFAVIVPSPGCPACMDEGEKIFDSIDKAKHQIHYLYFQDRDRDIFTVK